MDDLKIDNGLNAYICDMIKGNELDVANIVFEILAKKEFKFFRSNISIDTLLITKVCIKI